MPDYFKETFAVAMAIVVGYLFLRTVDPRNRHGAAGSLAISYGLGIGVITWVMLILSLTRIGLARPSLLVSISLIALTLILSCWRRCLQRDQVKTAEVNTNPTKKGSLSIENLLIVLITVEVILTFAQSLLSPIEAYDAAAIWGLKAKAIFLARGIPANLLQDISYRNYAYHPDYPLLVPLAQSYTCFFSSQYNEFVSKLVFPGFWLGCLLFAYSAAGKLRLTRTERLGVTFLLATTPYFSRQAISAYADVILAFYFGAGTVFLYWWIREKQLPDLVLSALFLGFAGMSKNEGLALGLMCWLVLILSLWWNRAKSKRTPGWGAAGLYALIQLALQSPWLTYRHSLRLANDIVNPEAFMGSLHWATLKRLVPIIYHYQIQVFGLRNWNLVWIVFVAVLIFRSKVIMRSDARYLLLSILLGFSLYTAVYLITPRDVIWHLKTSVSRVFLHLLPLTFFFLAQVYALEKSKSA